MSSVKISDSFLAIRERFPAASPQLSLLPAPPREANARALLLRAIVASNYGCGLLIAGGEHQPDGDFRRGEDLAQPDILPSVIDRAAARRDINVRRTGFIISEITRNRCIAICVPIAP